MLRAIPMLVLLASLSLAQRSPAAPELITFPPKVWASEPPPNCPFEPSRSIKGIEFLGRAARYTSADTWYPSWAGDGNLYSPWTDGAVNGLRSNSSGVDRPGGPSAATTGHATITGDDPTALTIVDEGVYRGDPSPYGGRYPSASLIHKGIWYYGTYCLMDSDGDPGNGLNWDILGPFVGFRYSKDFGKSWNDTTHTPSYPIFPEPAKKGSAVRFGAPHFVDFGREMERSPDGYAYLVGHGAADSDSSPRPANASWITGDSIYLARVRPSVKKIDDAKRWEFFGGNKNSGTPIWMHDFSRIRPLVDWNNHCGNVSITYNAPLRKYLMFVTDGVDTISKFHTWVLESGRITGPWRLVVFMKNFGEQAYFVNLPSKFISSDGRTAWLCYAANFSNGNKNWPHHDANPPGSGYGMVLQKVRFLLGKGK